MTGRGDRTPRAAGATRAPLPVAIGAVDRPGWIGFEGDIGHVAALRAAHLMGLPGRATASGARPAWPAAHPPRAVAGWFLA